MENDKLLVITELFLPTKGGTAVWFDEVYRRLGKKNIHIITADVPGAVEHDVDHPNTVHRLSLKRYGWLRPESLAMYAGLLWKSLSLSAHCRFRQVHAGRVLPEGLVGLCIAWTRRIPLVIYAHGEEITTWTQFGKFHAMKFTYQRAHKVIANSEFTRSLLIELGVPETNIAVIYPGVDIERYKPGLPCEDLKEKIGLLPGQKLILSVGRLWRRKGFDRVIESLKELLAQGLDAHYALVGTGEDWGYLSDLAAQLGVAHRVHMLGHVSMCELPRWYNACDIFAMPNRDINGDTEGFGMVYIEAAACGKPSVAGRAGGTGAAVEHGITGFRVDGCSVNEVANAIATLLVDETLRARMGFNALEKVCRFHGWQQVADVTASECRELRL